MSTALIGRKIGMTRLYDKSGKNVPVTVIQAGPCFVSQIKTVESDGYAAIQLAFEDVKARNSTMQLIGHDAHAGLTPKRVRREVRLSPKEVEGYQLGQEITVKTFDGIGFVDVVGTSKGKGFAGVMKRWGFKGQPASHGCERKHRSPGTLSGRATNRGYGKPKAGAHMPGQMGNARQTVRSLEVIERDDDNNLLLIKGAVPGANKGLVLIRKATRLSKSKAKAAKAS